MNYPSLSVAIAQWGQTDFTVRAIRALVSNGYPGKLEILVYDNASSDGPGGVAEFADVVLVRGHTNIGFGPAHNHLAELATGALLIIANNDCIPTPRSMEFMVDLMESDGQIGAVAPRYLNFDGSILEMGAFVDETADGWQLFRDATPPPYFRRMPFLADYSSAAFLLVRRELFLEHGGFDSAFSPAYYEDTDLCFRLRSLGMKTVVEPRAVVYHYEGATSGKDVSLGPKQLQVKHRSVFFNKWSKVLRHRGPMSLDAAVRQALGLHKASILWAAPQLPRSDRESGHARMVAMIRALTLAGNSVVFWGEHAIEWERYGPELEAMGVPWFAYKLDLRSTTEVPTRLSTVQEILTLTDWDAVVVSFPEMAARLADTIRSLAPGAAFVVDNVDLHYLRMARDPHTTVAEVHAAKKGELEIYEASDGVITASSYESSELAEELPGLPTFSFISVSSRPEPTAVASQDGAPVFLGNFKHAPNLDAIHWWLTSVSPELDSQGYGGPPLTVFGSGSELHRVEWEKMGRVDVLGWVPDLESAFALARVFVAPLTYGAGTKGKLLEAAYHGVPILATSVAAEGFAGNLRDALTVEDDPSSFARALVELMGNDELWADRRRSTLAAAEAHRLSEKVNQSALSAWTRRRSSAAVATRR